MPDIFLHDHKDFKQLLAIVGTARSLDPYLVEKDYWIMHCLYSLKQAGFTFHMKGGTSLSKGFDIIRRFSEDIDIKIEPPEQLKVKTGKNHTKVAHIQSRKDYYDWLATNMSLPGIIEVVRETAFDDIPRYRNGGLSLKYPSVTAPVAGPKEGILLEVGFDEIYPNRPLTISSWAYDHAANMVLSGLIDNRATEVDCYLPGYTFVEKLQAISTKYRRRTKGHPLPANFLRHYYDVYCLLANEMVQVFIGTDEYHAHKQKRFPAADNKSIKENQAFLLEDIVLKEELKKAYEGTAALYYEGQPPFQTLLDRIHENIDRL